MTFVQAGPLAAATALMPAAGSEPMASLAVGARTVNEPASVETDHLTSVEPGSQGYTGTRKFWEMHARAGDNPVFAAVARAVLDGDPIHPPAYYVGRSLNPEEARFAAVFERHLTEHFGKPWYGEGAPATNYYTLLDYAFFVGNLVAGFFREGIDHYAGANKTRIQEARAYLERLNRVSNVGSRPVRETIAGIIRDVLYGNKYEGSFNFIEGFRIAVDRSEAIADCVLSAGTLSAIDLFIDNVGPEFAANLRLAAFLADRHLVGRVRIHIKPYPYSISDVWGPSSEPTAYHVQQTLEALASSDDPEVRLVAQQVSHHLGGLITFQTDDFLVTEGDFVESAARFHEAIPDSSLVVVVGEYLYRKTFGNRKRLPTAEEDISSALPALGTPLALIRMVKSTVKVGIQGESKGDNTVGVIQLFKTNAPPA